MTSTPEFNPAQELNTSGILFRMALQSAKRSEIKGVGEHLYPNEARFREVDEFIVTVMLVHAAIESAWHWEFMINKVEPHHWPTTFFNGEGIKALCEKKSRTVTPLPDDVKSAVSELGAWRNFLQHGDSKSRANLEPFLGSGDVHPSMNYKKARHMLGIGDRFFEFLALSTGSQNVGPAALLWPGWD